MVVQSKNTEVKMLGSQRQKERQYWLNKLSGELVKSTFSYDYLPTDSTGYRIKKIEFALNELFSQLEAASKGSDIKLNMILITGLAVLLWKYTGNRDIILGTSVLKQKTEAKFINTVLALRHEVDPQMAFKELLLQVRETLIEATENQNFPIKSLLHHLDMPVEENVFPLFDTVIILENIQDKKYIRHIRPNVIFSFLKTGESLQGEVEYNPALYSGEKITQIIGHFINIMKQALANAGEKICHLNMFSPQEKKRLLEDFNNTRMEWEFSRGETVHEAFAHQAGKSPDYTAVVYEAQHLTYKTLNEKTDQLAVVLRERGVIPGSLVGIMVKRSEGMIPGILGILKAGGGYLPMEPEYPDSRNRFLVEDGKINWLITQDFLLEQKKEVFKGISPAGIISIDREAVYTSEPSGLSVSKPGSIDSKRDDAAYVIYTSGSTGKQKGVVVRHRNLINLVYGLNERIYKRYPASGTRLNIGFVSPYVFDASVKQIFAALLLGHCLHVIPEKIRIDGLGLLRYYRCYQVDVSDGTPTHLRLFIEGISGEKFKINVKHFVIGGEPLVPGLVRRFFDHFALEAPTITNVYGPTECCVDSTSYEITRENIALLKDIPIGTPMPNYRVYILNAALQLLPIGVTGEICIGGTGVARGYLNREKLTREKFVRHPLCPDSLLYRSGDLGKWLPDGNIIFSGRQDHQVKIRGFRVEPGEIESLLLEHKEIEEAVVIAREAFDHDKYLCAFIVSSSRAFEPAELREYLLKDVPDYLIPLYFEQLDKMPLTPNGKLDRHALSSREIKRTGPQRVYAAPQDDVEKKLVDIWGELLEMKKQEVSIHDNFFELGGHSLKAAILVSRIHKAFNVQVSLAEIFKAPLISKLAQFLKNSVEHTFVSIRLAEEKEYYALSSAQKRLYVLQKMDPGSTVYNMPVVMNLESEVNGRKLEQVFRKLIERHGGLRTSFGIIKEEPVQLIREKVSFEIEYYQVDVEDKVGEIIKKFIRPFDLSKAPLLRVGLLHISALGDSSIAAPVNFAPHDPGQEGLRGHYILLVDIHHIISDEISMKLFVRDFAALFTGKRLPSLKLQYKDYTKWHNNEKETGTIQKQAAFWQEQFQAFGQIPALELPTDFSRPKVQDFQGTRVTFNINKEVTGRLKNLATEQGTTLYMVLLAVFYVFLWKITGQETIIVGTAVAGRSHADLEQIIGMFVNTLGLINHPGSARYFNEFLEEVNEKTLQAFANQDYPFEELVEKVSVRRDSSRNPLFDVLFALQELNIDEIEIPGLKLVSYDTDTHTSKFELMLQVVEEKEYLRFIFEYSTSLFQPETIQRFIDYFRTVVRAAADQRIVKLSEIEIISAADKRRILLEFNNTRAEYPQDMTIDRLFTGQVEKHPDRIALMGLNAGTPIFDPGYQVGSETHTLSGKVGRDESMIRAAGNDSIFITYKELGLKSHRLASLLKEKGVQPDSIVGIMVERSNEMIIGIMGILKTGGAYLPIPPEYPADRLKYMLADSNVKVLLTTGTLADEFKKAGRKEDWENLHLVRLDGFYHQHHLQSASPLCHPYPQRSSSLAYIIYTSGSTGKSKGVMVNHRNVIRLIKNTNFINLRPGDRILQTGALEFDASTFEIWASLLNGISLYLVDKVQVLTLEKLKTNIAVHQITTMWLTSSLFNRMVQGDIEIFAGLRSLLVGGEVLSPSHIDQARKRYPELKIINGYGPTENTTFSTTFDIEKEYEENIPIGKPIANSTAYILDKNNKLLPIGIVGELCVGGDGVSRGYLNNPELTAEKFSRTLISDSALIIRPTGLFAKTIDHRYSIPNDRLYRTGDFARWLPCGNIEYLGRMDKQVKIRGFRIEPGEIENLLLSHSSIKEAAVIDRENDKKDKYLCAYIVSANEITLSELRTFLSADLPGYMIPSYFMMLEQIPLTPNGKIDQGRLPLPTVQVDDTFAPPENETHERMVQIWSDLLGIETAKISIDANFFEMGGHSLKAVMLRAAIHKRLNIDIPMTEIFVNPTIRGLALVIDALDWAGNPQIDSRQNREEVLL